MAKTTIYCPSCDHDFEGETWKNGSCPKCGMIYEWYEAHTEEDYWPACEWREKDWCPPSIGEVYQHYCALHNLNPELSSPAELFPNKCYAVACAMKALMPKGARAVYGGWLGEDVRRKEQPPFHRHGWVEYQGNIYDPTRFQFEGKEPYMYIEYQLSEKSLYDEGMASFRKAFRQPPPKRDDSFGSDGNKEYAFQWILSDKEFLTDLFGEERNWDILVSGELFWLCNLTPEELRRIIDRFYPQVAAHDLVGFIPIDYRAKYNHWVELGAFAAEKI